MPKDDFTFVFNFFFQSEDCTMFVRCYDGLDADVYQV